MKKTQTVRIFCNTMYYIIYKYILRTDDDDKQDFIIVIILYDRLHRKINQILRITKKENVDAKSPYIRFLYAFTVYTLCLHTHTVRCTMVMDDLSSVLEFQRSRCIVVFRCGFWVRWNVAKHQFIFQRKKIIIIMYLLYMH